MPKLKPWTVIKFSTSCDIYWPENWFCSAGDDNGLERTEDKLEGGGGGRGGAAGKNQGQNHPRGLRLVRLKVPAAGPPSSFSDSLLGIIMTRERNVAPSWRNQLSVAKPNSGGAFYPHIFIYTFMNRDRPLCTLQISAEF